MPAKKPTTVDEYIAAFPADVQAVLERVRATVRKAAPKAEETISYGIPALKLNGSHVVYFSGYKHHLSLHPVPKDVLQDELAPHVAGKGTLRFPLDRKMPLGLMAKVIRALLAENRERTAEKTARKRRTHTYAIKHGP